MYSFTTEAFGLLGVGLLVIATRTYSRTRKVGLRGFQPDDYLMLVAAGVYSAETTLAYSVGAYWHGLANNNVDNRETLDASSEEYILRVNGSKTQVAGWSTYTLLLWLLKACMCTFYLRLTEGLDHFRIRIYIGFGLIISTWLAVLFSILFGCGLPFEKNWQIYPDPGNHCQPAISNIDIFVTVVLNVITDIYLMTIPAPMLWKVRLPPLQKAGLFVLFSGGIFITTAGILRCVLIVTDPLNGAQQAGSWACRETFVAVVTTNLPMVWPFLHQVMGPIFGTMFLTKGSSGRTPEPGSFKLEDRSWKARVPRTANPIPEITFSESEEGIMNNNAGILLEVDIEVTSESKTVGDSARQNTRH